MPHDQEVVGSKLRNAGYSSIIFTSPSLSSVSFKQFPQKGATLLDHDLLHNLNIIVMGLSFENPIHRMAVSDCSKTIGRIGDQCRLLENWATADCSNKLKCF